MSIQTINLKDIPKNILNMIPFTVRINNNNGIINFSELSTDIQYLLLNNREIEESDPIEYENSVYDIKPQMSVYNDFITLETVKETIIEYFMNYIRISQGSYPFDPNHGNKLKESLFKKESIIIDVRIREELDFIENAITGTFGLPISIKNKSVTKSKNAGDIVYNLDLFVIINKKEPFTLNLTI